jgi:hypothetical protein
MKRKLTFTIAENPVYWRTHRIIELCDYLTAKVLQPLFEGVGKHWEPQFMSFFELDNGCDPLEPTGTILFRVPPLLAGREDELVGNILKALWNLKIKTGEFVYERHPVTHAALSVQIPIIENPTALVAPPEVNMSQTRGYVVLRDLLGYEKVNGRYEFTAQDLISRLGTVTEDRIAACTASPVKGQEGVRRTPSPVSMHAVRRCLDEVKQYAQWAISHNYGHLAAV